MAYCSATLEKFSRAHTTYLVNMSCSSQLCASLYPRARSIVGQENLLSETSLTTEQVYNCFAYYQWHQKILFEHVLSVWQDLLELTELFPVLRRVLSPCGTQTDALKTLAAFTGLSGQVSCQGFLLFDPGSNLWRQVDMGGLRWNCDCEFRSHFGDRGIMLPEGETVNRSKN